MAIRYRISTWASSTAMEAREFRSVSRIDAALTELWAQCYSMIEGDGARDTERGQRIHAEFLAFEKECNAVGSSALFGHYFTKKFSLRTECAGDLGHVLFVAIRD